MGSEKENRLTSISRFHHDITKKQTRDLTKQRAYPLSHFEYVIRMFITHICIVGCVNEFGSEKAKPRLLITQI